MLLIDGYNVLFARGVMKDVARAREGLVARIDAWCGRSGRKARIFFDSREGPLRGRRNLVEILYVAAGDTADAAIGRLVAGTADRTAYRVVTSDREIADAARKRNVDVLSSEEFLRELEGPTRPEEEPRAKRDGISDGEARYWMNEFGLPGNDHEAQ